MNPYLAFAAFLAAGLHGIERGLELQPEFAGNAYASSDVPSVPRTLREATTLLDGSQVLRAAFGDEVIDHYVHAGRWEQAVFDKAVTDWELLRYFERA